MDIFFSALLQVLAPQTLAVMLVGIAVGLVVGILPGLGGAATLAMMLPFVYPMDAISAFAFLLGMHAVTATGGDITSVLFGIPGEATSAATVLDGYPMTRHGDRKMSSRNVDGWTRREYLQRKERKERNPIPVTFSTYAYKASFWKLVPMVPLVP